MESLSKCAMTIMLVLPQSRCSGSTDPDDHLRPRWQTERGVSVTTGRHTHSHCCPQRSAGTSGPVKK